ncbi:hypothetical protein Avbf_00214 [Armadillidium vulgare]|nr:hypothetical protein Avbf_00214 [Armadillidium vulgare]
MVIFIVKSIRGELKFKPEMKNIVDNFIKIFYLWRYYPLVTSDFIALNLNSSKYCYKYSEKLSINLDSDDLDVEYICNTPILDVTLNIIFIEIFFMGLMLQRKKRIKETRGRIGEAGFIYVLKVIFSLSGIRKQ